PTLTLVENPDILRALGSAGALRPRLLVGFAAETEPDRDRLIALAEAKRLAKGCDWIVANDVSPGTGTFGGETNTVHLVTAAGAESWPAAAKTAVADRLVGRAAAHLTAEAPAA
ncbi:MAG: bifunctional phosphopantothenoylcysteine decarboxylase/phosphopantothenate synthase, partial [Proteobacteria bacterium]|nr:bifunctional phosphopantothenoylcysteine decarboxylase/phosphopantothenate synthase [Pseudomonadota bacterium]